MKRTRLRILQISPEMSPFAKAGGLADVVAALSPQLSRAGHEVHVVLPWYGSIRDTVTVDERRSSCVSMGDGEEWVAFNTIRDSHGVAVHFVEHEGHFGRWGMYHDSAMNDYGDNARRFGFLCRAALQYCRDTGFSPDIVHAHDWQAALAPHYLKRWFWNDPVLGKCASVLTIHNIAYQGVYPSADRTYLGIDDESFREWGYESFGSLNLLKGGICLADAVNTVSPGHAREILQPYQGFGLAPFLVAKGRCFRGILNGADYDNWSPETDSLIPARFSQKDMSGKAVCKRALQEAFGLEPDPAVCLIGAVGRFVDQKGYRLVAEIFDRMLEEMHVQFAVLGTGERDLESYFGAVPARWPGRAGSYIGYNNKLAHLVEAGADFFIMPSLFEPCGLTQMYALRYGTLPIVRATGGLDDTIVQYDEHSGGGTGFKFWDTYPEALYYTVGWAVSTFYDRHHHMSALVKQAMETNFCWKKSCAEYEKLYESALEAKADYDRAHSLA